MASEYQLLRLTSGFYMYLHTHAYIPWYTNAPSYTPVPSKRRKIVSVYFSKLVGIYLSAGKMTQEVKTLATEPDDLTSIARWKERLTHSPSFDFPHVLWCTHLHIHLHNK